MCVMKKNYMNIITGQTNSFSRWVHPTNAVSIVMLTLGFKAPTLIFAQQRVTP